MGDLVEGNGVRAGGLAHPGELVFRQGAVEEFGCESGGGGAANWSGGMPLSTSSTSAAWRTSTAPCRIRPLVPAAQGSSGEPGIAITSRTCSPAIRAAMNDPERSAASTMTVSRGEAGNDAFAAGNVLRAGAVADGAFRDDQALLGNLVAEALVLGRVDMVRAAAENRNRAFLEAGGVGSFFRLGFRLAEARLGSREEPADVRAVSPEHQDGQKREPGEDHRIALSEKVGTRRHGDGGAEGRE